MTDKRVALWLLRSAGKYKGYIVLLLLLQALGNGGAVCYALVMKKMVDCAMAGNCTGFVSGLVTFGLLLIFLMTVRMVLRQMEEWVKSGIENRLKERFFEQLLCKDYA